MKRPDGMTDKQWMFCLEYVKDFNATRAAKAAGYSENTAQVIGSENLSKPLIKQALNQIFTSSAMGVEELFHHLSKIGRGLPEKYFDKFGNINFRKLKEDGMTDLIQGVTETAAGKSFRIYDRQRALEMIGRGHAAFTDRTIGDQDVNITVKLVDDDEG